MNKAYVGSSFDDFLEEEGNRRTGVLWKETFLFYPWVLFL